MEQEQEIAGHTYAAEVNGRRISSRGWNAGMWGFGGVLICLVRCGFALVPRFSPLVPAQVGSYFLTAYYNVLTNQPHRANQFYTDNSSVVRLDCETGQWSFGETVDVCLLNFHSLR
jgi:hypothetical protein